MLSCVETFIYVHLIVTNNNHIEVHSCHYPSVRIRFNRTQRQRSGECTRIWRSLLRIELSWPVCVGLRDTLTENFVLSLSPTSPLCDYHIEIHYTASLDLFSILLRLSMILSLGLQRNVLQYGVLSSFPDNWRSSHSPSSIVGLMRLCLGSNVTSNDLPPDLHSNHIEIHLLDKLATTGRSHL